MIKNTYNAAVASLFCTKHQAHIIVTRTDHNLPTTSQRGTINKFLVSFVFPDENTCARIPRPKGMICRRRNDEVWFCRVHQ